MKTNHDIYEVKMAIHDLKTQKEKFCSEKRLIESQIQKLNMRVRAGGRIPDQEYKSICKQQGKAKEKIKCLDEKILLINQDLRQWYAIEDEIRANVGLSMSLSVIPENSLIYKITAIRDKYLAFSEDHTRVNSMRLMASAFAAELTEMISRE